MSETTSKKEINMVKVPVLAISERPLFPETLTTLMIARPEDVKAVAMEVLRHRIILSYEAEAEEVSAELVVQKILDSVEVP